jgi:glutamyl/glutaminyl-tRNA synthetase
VQPDDDPVLMRADGEPAYPLAVVIDDAQDGVTEVVRGADLLTATATQIRLHEALGLPLPTYLHVPVLKGPDGRKLSKSHGATEIRALRGAGWTREAVWRLLLPFLGLPPGDLHTATLDPALVPRRDFTVSF